MLPYAHFWHGLFSIRGEALRRFYAWVLQLDDAGGADGYYIEA